MEDQYVSYIYIQKWKNQPTETKLTAAAQEKGKLLATATSIMKVSV